MTKQWWRVAVTVDALAYVYVQANSEEEARELGMEEVEPSEAELADPIEVVDCELATQEEYENWRKGREDTGNSMKVTREQLEKIIESFGEARYDDGYDDGHMSGQNFPFGTSNGLSSSPYVTDLEFLLDLLFNPPAEPVQQHVGSREAEIQAQCLSNAGIQACYMCGLPTSECDRLAQESGFDECEYLAGK